MTANILRARYSPVVTELPRFQAVILRRVMFPAYCRWTSWDRAIRRFDDEGNRVVRLVERLSSEAFRTPAVIRPLWGIEASSRTWSAEMVLEHLIDVGARIAMAVVELSRGEQPQDAIMDGHPGGGGGLGLVQDYRVFVRDYVGTLREDVGNRASRLTHPHPWFGELDARQWACVAAFHQVLRRRQLSAIAAWLSREVRTT